MSEYTETNGAYYKARTKTSASIVP